VRLAERKRGFGRFCTRKCAGKFNNKKQNKLPNLVCAFCGEEFYRAPSKMVNSKSRLYFCCREHKDLAQRLGGIDKIQPSHYGTSNSPDSYTYRRIAFESHPAQCNRC
jgi:hypothetical protein